MPDAEPTAPTCPNWCTTVHDGAGGWDQPQQGSPGKTCLCQMMLTDDLAVFLEQHVEVVGAGPVVSAPVIRLTADLVMSGVCTVELMQTLATTLLLFPRAVQAAA